MAKKSSSPITPHDLTRMVASVAQAPVWTHLLTPKPQATAPPGRSLRSLLEQTGADKVTAGGDSSSLERFARLSQMALQAQTAGLLPPEGGSPTGGSGGAYDTGGGSVGGGSVGGGAVGSVEDLYAAMARMAQESYDQGVGRIEQMLQAQLDAARVPVEGKVSLAQQFLDEAKGSIDSRMEEYIGNIGGLAPDEFVSASRFGESEAAYRRMADAFQGEALNNFARFRNDLMTGLASSEAQLRAQAQDQIGGLEAQLLQAQHDVELQRLAAALGGGSVSGGGGGRRGGGGSFGGGSAGGQLDWLGPDLAMNKIEALTQTPVHIDDFSGLARSAVGTYGTGNLDQAIAHLQRMQPAANTAADWIARLGKNVLLGDRGRGVAAQVKAAPSRAQSQISTVKGRNDKAKADFLKMFIGG